MDLREQIPKPPPTAQRQTDAGSLQTSHGASLVSAPTCGLQCLSRGDSRRAVCSIGARIQNHSRISRSTPTVEGSLTGRGPSSRKGSVEAHRSVATRMQSMAIATAGIRRPMLPHPALPRRIPQPAACIGKSRVGFQLFRSDYLLMNCSWRGVAVDCNNPHVHVMNASWLIVTIAVAVGAILCADSDLQTFWLDKLAGAPGAGSMEGRAIWITGASSGIGEALALEYAGTNATLVLSARRRDRLELVAAAAMSAGATEVHVVPLDVVAVLAGDRPGDRASSFEQTVADVLAKVGRLDVLVLNAGGTKRGLAEEMALSDTRRLLELNFFAVVEHARAALPALRASRGQLVITSSFTGKLGSPISAAYSATKHALQGYFGAMRGEVKDVDITLLCPGPVASEIAEAAGVKESNANKMPAARAARLMHTAIHHRLYETWISPHPAMHWLYVGQMAPDLAAWYTKYNVGPKRVEAFKSGGAGGFV